MAENVNILVAADARRAIGELNRTSAAISRLDKSTAKGAANSQRFGNALSKGARVGGLALLGLGYGLKKTLDVAGNFQQQLNVLGAVSGATGGEIKKLSALAIKLGNDAKLPATSAKDAADAMTELAKAGLSVKDTMSAARGVLQLSAAGQLDNATAASITANALQAFNLEGREANRVADLLAAGANASSADVSDMALSLQQSASSAHQLGVPVEDLTTAIAEMANQGIKGSDAGTSLKTMFTRLAAPTAAGAKELKKLNIQAFDAQGNFIGLEATAGQFQKALVKLNPKQRAQALSTIFGSDAQRAANVVLGQGADKFDELKGKVTESGAAQKLAAAQTQGYKGAVEAFKSSVETLGITIGTKLLPTFTNLAREASGLVGFIDGNQTAAFALIGTVASLAAGIVILNAGYKAWKAAAEAAFVAQKILNSAVVANPYVLLGAAIVAIGVYALTTRDNTNFMADAFENARRNVDALSDALRNQKSAQIDSKQAQLDQANAAARLGDATAHVTELVKSGKKGTEEYGQALRDQNQAELDLQRAQLRRQDATAKERAANEKARSETKKLNGQMDKLTEATKKQSREAQHAGGRWDGFRFKVQDNDGVVRGYSVRMQALSNKLGVQAKRFQELSPKAAAAAIKLKRAAEASSLFASQLGRIPDKKTLDIYINTFTTNMGNLNTSGRGRSLPRGTPGNKPGERAMGGPVRAGEMYIVGEHRPELFVPDQNGTIIPRVTATPSGGSKTVVYQTFNLKTKARNPRMAATDLGRQLRSAGASW